MRPESAIQRDIRIELPFPSGALAGHQGGHWRVKRLVVAKHRAWAFAAALEAKPIVPADGDIAITVRFTPPDNRGDRVNFPNRMKPYFDGIADALKVNDKRFVPVFIFADPRRPGMVEVYI